ncbi:uncharacterized protein [Struthio camelus]|uniref:uncharacterized protein n=1 Tax=Struthio camelus TaxID=8801 RepID=UPI00360422EE
MQTRALGPVAPSPKNSLPHALGKASLWLLETAGEVLLCCTACGAEVFTELARQGRSQRGRCHKGGGDVAVPPFRVTKEVLSYWSRRALWLPLHRGAKAPSAPSTGQRPGCFFRGRLAKKAGWSLARAPGTAPPQPRPGQAGKEGQRQAESGDGEQQRAPARKARPGRQGREGTGRRASAAQGDGQQPAAGRMSRAEEVCPVPEREGEPAAACAGGPSEGSEAKSKVSRSSRAGLLFPVSRIDRLLRRGRFAKRIGAAAPIYLAAALQCVAQHTVEVAGKISKESKKQRISPRHLQLAAQSSPELKQLLRGAPRRQGSAVPHSQPVASPLNKKKKRKSEKRWLGQQAAAVAAAACAPASSK